MASYGWGSEEVERLIAAQANVNATNKVAPRTCHATLRLPPYTPRSTGTQVVVVGASLLSRCCLSALAASQAATVLFRFLSRHAASRQRIFCTLSMPPACAYTILTNTIARLTPAVRPTPTARLNLAARQTPARLSRAKEFRRAPDPRSEPYPHRAPDPPP